MFVNVFFQGWGPFKPPSSSIAIDQNLENVGMVQNLLDLEFLIDVSKSDKDLVICDSRSRRPPSGLATLIRHKKQVGSGTANHGLLRGAVLSQDVVKNGIKGS